ncbi:SGNH/GDSL hydrolase family protein [Pseudomonas chlororaphis]|uniref:SGNH/GDSL hydrolase family protein n=1 Tax=Pseudomonas chlororaphis TaxID=587753 RepID=UPI0006A5EB42|nr:SGNH/GDSL hydrolase family protein [Pseudomonas chlororaphis]AZD02489.1 Lysophospholipase L1 [Pseudomonas chlororaphis subsp. chlororaphis]MBM0280537.1 SGNH/GDSL hydrolase family protein [Pseudomonas chlororaphis]MDO1504823.1 SGNH/GDSL hydrolase family protein [Pseudomonas chlororaphis]ORM44427.1 lipase [Pseudomonas chlororaphis subsp. chlororaphis]TWR95951.1 SGNH/GDSL hydrolase family protein [Pseudomonas chlororaphis subsp. chlororaphis]
MTDVFAKVALGPLLLAQGLYTRWVTPRLPEAEGPRQGRHADACGPALRLLILGDSAAAGVGALTQDEAIAGRLVAGLAGDFQLSWQLRAQSGLDSRQLFQLLEDGPAEPFDVALVSIGVNDVTSRIAAAEWQARISRLIALLSERFEARHIVFLPVPPMHLFPALPQPLRWYLGLRARRFNSLLVELLAGQDRCALLATRFQPAASLMAGDSFHPSPALYQILADEAARVIRQRYSR